MMKLFSINTLKGSVFVFILLLCGNLFGQTTSDSLRKLYTQNPDNPEFANHLAEALVEDSLVAARTLAHQAILLATADGNYFEKGRAEFIVGDTWWYANDFEEAARWFGKSAQSYQQAGDPLMAANGYNDMAFVWNQIDRYEEAIEAYRKSMKLLLSIGDNENLPAVLVNIGQVHHKLGNPDSAIFYNNQAAALSNVPGREEEYSAALSNLGLIYKNMGDFQQALKYYNHALEISKKMNQPVWMAIDLNNIANVYSLWQKYDLAKRYLTQSIQISQQLNDPAAMEVNLNNLAYAYQESGDLDSALILYNQSAAIAEELGRFGNLAVRKINIGMVYYRKGEYDKAAEFVKAGLATNRQLGLKLSVSGALHSLGVIYQAKGQLRQSKIYLDEALAIARALNARLVLEKIYEARSKLFDKMGDYRAALDDYRKFVAIRDSVFTTQSQEKLAEMQARFETEKKQQHIEMLIKDNALQKTELRKKQITLLALVGGIVILAISALIIGLLYMQKSKANRKLVEKNLELMKQEENVLASADAQEWKPGVPDEETNRIVGELEHLMKSQKIYTQQQITLAALASELKTNTSYLSHIINEKYKMNFSNFLNSYRIREAQKMFTRNQHHTMTLEGIAESVGYHSRSTFNAAFKKISGVTPSVFIKNMEEINKNQTLEKVLNPSA
ncbi:MAG: tetratricopeptide repeat protein [Bacteroidales bacterium]|nr:tetratricopeptide repeat protein [Bacteroidales bacterium]MDD3130559.1 tetratricopeptide repeat protein [Bacteroidales bacterium]MDD3526812.1 tetratricopeptide repeat protein [Bacteroidales bacterium]MDD4178042.1 tetratricopeptide repeat protein [Bacteroidales bacterium]